jgi:hypothetical protein
MLTAILSSVVTAVVLSVLAVATTWGRGILQKVIRRNQADHGALHAGSWPVHLPPESGSSDARILILCAPSHSFRATSFDFRRAIEFAQQRIGFVGEPAYSSLKDGVRLDAPCGGGSGDYVWVCVNGKVHLSVTLPVVVGLDGRRSLDILELMMPLATVASAVSSADFRLLHGLPRRAVRMKTDWLIGVSMYSQVDGAPVPSWNELGFPEASAPRVMPDRQPFCPPTGYAADLLQSWEVDRPVPDLIRIFLGSFLGENGYHDFDHAVEQTISNFQCRPI